MVELHSATRDGLVYRGPFLKQVPYLKGVLILYWLMPSNSYLVHEWIDTLIDLRGHSLV